MLLRSLCMLGLVATLALPARSEEWPSNGRYRVLLTVDPGDRIRSRSPAAVELDFQSHLKDQTFDEHTLEVMCDGRPVPHRLDKLFGSNRATLNFVVPDQKSTHFAVYFDSRDSGRGDPKRYPGLVGDGDRFREVRQVREITASHFDQFVDFDGDGDFDLFKGGVEPYVYCFENVGVNRLVERGRLSSGGKLFTLPCSKANRSWVSVAFFDVDDDGDQDFFPSFGDGPDAGRIVFYQNTTKRNEPLEFTRVGPLATASGVPLAGGAAEGGWFPSIKFVRGWDGDDPKRLDALVGSNHHCWLYRGAGRNLTFAEPVALQAGDAEINLVNPRFDCADLDNDGDLDILAGTQPGPVWYYENTGTRAKPALATGRVLAFDCKYLIGDAHTGVTIADFDGDTLLDFVAGRFWERTDLMQPERPRDFGGFYRNVGSREAPRFARATRGAPFTEQFQICDAARQNCVRSFDWDSDGKLDLLAGDTDGFIWLFRNEGSQLAPLFSPGQKVLAGARPLSVATSGGHARLDVCDWDSDGKMDLVVADGHGTLTLFRGDGEKSKPALATGERMQAGGKPIQVGDRSSVLACDWDNDGRLDLVLADDRGYYLCRNTTDAARPALAAPERILFARRPASYVRPNLGSFVDWDGDGQRDFVGAHFENSLRWYRNLSPAERGAMPRFADPEGVTILQASSPQMISGVHAVDWNGDGDVDLLTGQGHGGSGLRFYERDWIEDELRGTHPKVSVGELQTKS